MPLSSCTGRGQACSIEASSDFVFYRCFCENFDDFEENKKNKTIEKCSSRLREENGEDFRTIGRHADGRSGREKGRSEKRKRKEKGRKPTR